jgi:MFS family permease
MKISNLAVYTVTNSIAYFAWGLIGPFYYLYVNQLGGGNIEQFGIAFGIMCFMSALGSLLAGKYSDKLGRKPFLISTSFLFAIIIFSYTLINSVIQLYIIQALFGVISSVDFTINSAYLGDITKKKKRGVQIGAFRFVVEAFSGIAIILGGVLIGKTGNFKLIFYICSILTVIGTLGMFYLKETVRRR